MQKTPQQLEAEFDALLAEFDKATRGLLKPRDEPCALDQPTAKIYRLSDYRVLH